MSGIDLTLDEKSKIAAQFIAQAPPGEVNDVINDVRGIIGDDTALMPHVVTELQKYNLAQLQVVEHAGPGGAHPSLLSKAAIHPDDETRYVDAVGKQSFLFDHITLTVSDYQPYELPEEEETFRAELAKSLAAYAKNHFPSGVSSVSCSQIPLLPPAPEFAAPEPVAPTTTESAEVPAATEATEGGEISAPVTDIVSEIVGAGEAEPAPTPLNPSAAPVETEEVDAPGGLEKVDEAVEEAKKEEEGEVIKEPEEEKVVEEESKVEEEPKVEEEVAPVVEEKTEVQSEPPVEEPPAPAPRKQERIENPKYTLEIVGNRYNPSNFWTGRWRTQWVVDTANSKVDGKIIVDVHYYEQGNVQLATEHSASFPMPEKTASQSLASQIVTNISKIETAYHMELNDVYNDFGEKTFRSLRRVLPVTRQKIDWENVAGYTLGADLKK